MNRSHSITLVIGLIVFISLISGLVWGIYHFANENIGGEGFFIHWIGVRGLVTDGRSPYSNLTSSQIQESIRYQNSFSKGNPPIYSSPLYSGVIVFPFALIESRVLTHTLWLTAQLIALIVILIVGLKITGWKPAWYIFMLFSILTIFSYHVFIPWLDGGLSIWASFFMVVAFLAIYNYWNEVGGILLALAAIQPQMTILVIVFTLIWAVSRKNKVLIIWFFLSIVSISIIITFLVPGWIEQYLKLIYNFSDNFPAGNPGMLFRDLWPGLGKQLGWMMTAICVFILVIEWFFALRKDFRWFLWTACLTMVISQWIGIPAIPANFTGLILPLILVSAMLSERWQQGGQWIAVFLTLVVFVWEWALLILDLNSYQPGMQLNLLIPLPLILFIGLYWVRWWAIKPNRLIIEELRFGEIY